MDELERQDKVAYVMEYVRNQSALVNTTNIVQSESELAQSTKRVDSMKSKDGSVLGTIIKSTLLSKRKKKPPSTTRITKTTKQSKPSSIHSKSPLRQPKQIPKKQKSNEYLPSHLLDSFKAPNVNLISNRISLDPQSTAGIFNKSKSSTLNSIAQFKGNDSQNTQTAKHFPAKVVDQVLSVNVDRIEVEPVAKVNEVTNTNVIVVDREEVIIHSDILEQETHALLLQHEQSYESKQRERNDSSDLDLGSVSCGSSVYQQVNRSSMQLNYNDYCFARQEQYQNVDKNENEESVSDEVSGQSSFDNQKRENVYDESSEYDDASSCFHKNVNIEEKRSGIEFFPVAKQVEPLNFYRRHRLY